jgi:PAS domain S-box-containing protein
MIDLETAIFENDRLLAKIDSLEKELSQTRALLDTEAVRRLHVFDVVLSNIPDLICTFGLDGRFTYANPALLVVWQKSLEEIIGKNTFDLNYPPDLAARIQAEVEKVIATKQPVRNQTPFTPVGQRRVFMSTSFPRCLPGIAR